MKTNKYKLFFVAHFQRNISVDIFRMKNVFFFFLSSMVKIQKWENISEWAI